MDGRASQRRRAAPGWPQEAGPGKVSPDLKAAAREYTHAALLTLVRIMQDSKAPDAACVAAAIALLDRGHGKPTLQVTGPDGPPVQVNLAIVRESIAAKLDRIRAVGEAMRTGRLIDAKANPEAHVQLGAAPNLAHQSPPETAGREASKKPPPAAPVAPGPAQAPKTAPLGSGDSTRLVHHQVKVRMALGFCEVLLRLDLALLRWPLWGVSLRPKLYAAREVYSGLLYLRQRTSHSRRTA